MILYPTSETEEKAKFAESGKLKKLIKSQEQDLIKAKEEDLILINAIAAEKEFNN